MACKCFKEIEEKMDARMRKHYGENAAEIDESSFANQVYLFEEGDFCNVMLPYLFRFYKRKKNGDLEQRLTNGDTKVAINYCPFCGTKFEGAAKEKESAH
ncbi:hypothetical protein [Rouxiella badensis]|uniref:hypothetical protein n=1 Tax=Rouxiella badensis TaxID=1646377 RepID=UPI0022AB25F5|nr:hypothetical protein [Rouxiella badensis]WAT10105.2 hypothetical protein O1V65_05960 [Rouxiella badensis]